MTSPAPHQVHVRVPATTANLGCGFDVLGLALQLYNVFTLTKSHEPGWRVSLPPGVRLPTHDNNLVFRAARHVFERLGHTPSGLHLSVAIDIPLARGLGSSSSAIIGGLLAANTLSGSPLSQEALLAMAVTLEGHPDNVTPALLGGLTLSYRVGVEHRYQQLPFPDDLRLVVAVPNFELPTTKARAILPAQVSREDAVFNSSRTALLVSALYSQRYDLLAAAMDDRLHQPYRAALVPGMAEAITAGYAAKALGVALSGAGPTLLAISVEAPEGVATALHDAFVRHRIGCTTHILQADRHGACVW